MATRTLTLSDFLLARIAEDERLARLATSDGGWPRDGAPEAEWTTPADPDRDGPWHEGAVSCGRPWRLAEVFAGQCAPHIARWDPARVLAECEAKRRIVELHRDYTDGFETITYAGDMLADSPRHAVAVSTLELLALPYADHPDYDEAWRP